MPSIKLVTEIPGPKSIALLERRKAAVARGPFHATSVFVDRARDSLLEDVDGNHLLDFGSGIAVNNLGHCREEVVAAVSKQAQRFLHTSFNINPYEGYVALCEKLNEIVPGNFAKKSFLANSGAEAVENAIKIARHHTKRPAIVCFDHAFHGRTYMAMALTSKAQPYKHGFAPFPSDVYRAPFPYAYRWPESAHHGGGDVSSECFAALESLVMQQIGADQVAAIVLEPVLGEGGFVPAPLEFMKRLRTFCTQIGALLVVDEIQTGFGRTGSLFALNHFPGVDFDLLTLAKGMGSGMPISAVVGRQEIMDSVSEGGIGGTFGGNPLSCAAALAGIAVMETPSFLEHAVTVGKIMRQRLGVMQSRFPGWGDIRGLGPMVAIECVKDRTTKAPDKEGAMTLTRGCLRRGLVTLSCGTFGNVVRLLPPLTISTTDLNEGLDVIEATQNDALPAIHRR